MMPTNKHKRKASTKVKFKAVKNVHSLGLISAHPKLFVLVGLLLVALAIYLFAFEAQDDAMFGFAMLALITGVAVTIYANFARPKKKQE
ncbi:hypothetical protein MTCD1_03076 [Colwellia marinimaniae]|uniref:Uncharacterized protein n=2 Tax=Colwelliaceae TaxID=267889 RepID=A0ABQ0MYP2_9GAMM|nr:hypothetical protein MTCD1_03076 [Colwellia marinimaniae]